MICARARAQRCAGCHARGMADRIANLTRKELGMAVTEPEGDAGEVRPVTGHDRHYPTISSRKPGSTVALLKRARDLRAIYLGRRLDPAFREEIMLAVAGANSCRQCSFAHREWALAEGLPEAELAALEGLDAESFDARTWAAIAWAQAYARSDLAEVPDAVDANFRSTSALRSRRTSQLVARTMYWMNEASNGVRAGLEAREAHSGAGKHRAPRARGAAPLRGRCAPRPRSAERQAATQPDLADPRDPAVLQRVRLARSKHDLRTGEKFGG